MVWGFGCWCGSGKKWTRCHYPHCDPEADRQSVAQIYRKTWRILVKSPRQIEGMRKAGAIAARILDELCSFAKEGVSLKELEILSRQLHHKEGVRPAPLGYGSPPFPASICTSLNEVICHGIPDAYVLKKGDILNIDVTVIWKGHYGDSSRMVCIEPISQPVRTLVETCKEALELGIAQIQPGKKVSDIGAAIAPFAEERGFSVVDDFVGHGTGIQFHEPPNVFHSVNKVDIPFYPGMTFTIEPMLNLGEKEGITDPSNGWTVRTADGLPSAQWEHTLLVTDKGCEILTPYP
ncbi:methionyl aminopeptidase [Candidatus Similichlamydia laticola]|uniref:Methionine aminopeptidase n=1 Tax=Candidatus Similichlamydia laticola TaxID=2170265 RepID=A0A369KEV9_9BACT|nr:methionyl aminopeptidase [Candidatus Similichlamydia laticola]RDB31427.1 Methionine aminopeptidase [Candidatus Similichlamydia laticola]